MKYLLTFFVIVTVTFASSKTVMPYMCLERCGYNSTDIENHIKQLEEHDSILNQVVSFEMYGLGVDGYLEQSTVITPVLEMLTAPNLVPMISTYNDTDPHRRPTDIIHIRTLFENPETFINQAIGEVKKHGLASFSLDLEPPSGATTDDAIAYANFLTVFADALHNANPSAKLMVDAATWGDFWDYDLIAKTNIDDVVTMETYTGDELVFCNSVEKDVALFGTNKLRVGMMTVNPNTNEPYTDEELQSRFDCLDKNGIEKIAIWCMPIPGNWFPFLEKFLEI